MKGERNWSFSDDQIKYKDTYKTMINTYRKTNIKKLKYTKQIQKWTKYSI